MQAQLWSIALIVASTILSSLGSFYMKVASARLSLSIITVIKNIPLLVAVFLHVTSAVIGVIAYRGGELTILVPLGSLNYVWASLLAVRYLDEKMNRWKWLGTASIIAGIVLIGLGDVL